MFMWGETPLGIFQEPMSLNQLICDQEDDHAHHLDIKAVKNGSHFAVLVEKQTGMTF